MHYALLNSVANNVVGEEVLYKMANSNEPETLHEIYCGSLTDVSGAGLRNQGLRDVENYR